MFNVFLRFPIVLYQVFHIKLHSGCGKREVCIMQCTTQNSTAIRI